MLTKDKIIDRLTKLNHGRFVFKCVGTEEDFVRTYAEFKKYHLSLQNKKGNLALRHYWNDILGKKYREFIKNCYLKQIW